MDNAFVKGVQDEFGDIDYYKVIYNDNKFSSVSGWTPNQKSEIIHYFRNNPSVEYITMEIRTSNNLLDDAGISYLRQGSEVRLYRQDVYKTLSNGDNANPLFDDIIKMNDVSFAD